MVLLSVWYKGLCSGCALSSCTSLIVQSNTTIQLMLSRFLLVSVFWQFPSSTPAASTTSSPTKYSTVKLVLLFALFAFVAAVTLLLPWLLFTEEHDHFDMVDYVFAALFAASAPAGTLCAGLSGVFQVAKTSTFIDTGESVLSKAGLRAQELVFVLLTVSWQVRTLSAWISGPGLHSFEDWYWGGFGMVSMTYAIMALSSAAVLVVGRRSSSETGSEVVDGERAPLLGAESRSGEADA